MSEYTAAPPIKSMLTMLLTAFMWSIAGLFIKLIPWNPLVIACLRSAIAAVVVFAYMKIARLRLVFDKQVFLCALALGTTMIFFVCANKFTTSANAIVLQNTSPVFIMLIGFFAFGRKITWPQVAVIACTVVGISLFFIDSLSTGGMLGNIMALIAGFGFASFMILSKEVGDSHKSNTAILLGQIITAVLCLPGLFFFPPVWSPQSAGAICLLGVLQLGLPYVLYAIAIRGCSALTCSLIGMAEPLFSPLWVFLAVGEAPGPLALLGGAIVLAAVTAWCVYSAKAPQTAG